MRICIITKAGSEFKGTLKSHSATAVEWFNSIGESFRIPLSRIDLMFDLDAVERGELGFVRIR